LSWRFVLAAAAALERQLLMLSWYAPSSILHLFS